MRIDGREVSTVEVMTSSELAALVSYQGPLLGVSYRLTPPPQQRPPSTWSTLSGSIRETSSPVDAGDPGTNFDPFADRARKPAEGL